MRLELSEDDQAFREEMRASVTEHSRMPVEAGLWDDFASGIHYQQGDFADPASYKALAERLDQVDAAAGTRGNVLFYLATQESAFPGIVQQLGRVGLDHEHHAGGWRRVVIEKPFGHDLDSAKRLNREVGKTIVLVTHDLTIAERDRYLLTSIDVSATSPGNFADLLDAIEHLSAELDQAHDRVDTEIADAEADLARARGAAGRPLSGAGRL